MSNENQTVRSGGYRFLHSFLCAIAVLIVIFCISNTAALRYYIASDSLTDNLRAARLSDAAVPFTGKNLAEYIRENYVTDDNVLTEDVAAAADGMEIPSFIAGKLDQHFALLRGNSNTPVEITGEELTGLLDQIAESLHESAMLIIEEGDKQQILDTANPVLTKVNAVSTTLGSSQAGRAFERFGISIWAYVLEGVLIVLLAWRWCVIRKNSGKDIPGAFKSMGITILIPASISLLLILLGAGSALFAKDNVIGLYGVLKTLRAPYWYITATFVTFSIFLLELAAYLRVRAKIKAEAPAKPKPEKKQVVQKAAAAPAVAMTHCVQCGKEIETGVKFCKYCGGKQEAPKPQPAPAPAPQSALVQNQASAAASDVKTCISCGKEISAKMKFCKFCGTNQETGENIVDAVLNGTAGMPEAPAEDAEQS